MSLSVSLTHCFGVQYSANINNVPLNPTRPETMSLVEGLLKEMSGLFTDNFFHVGGDEVGV